MTDKELVERLKEDAKETRADELLDPRVSDDIDEAVKRLEQLAQAREGIGNAFRMLIGWKA